MKMPHCSFLKAAVPLSFQLDKQVVSECFIFGIEKLKFVRETRNNPSSWIARSSSSLFLKQQQHLSSHITQLSTTPQTGRRRRSKITSPDVSTSFFFYLLSSETHKRKVCPLSPALKRANWKEGRLWFAK